MPKVYYSWRSRRQPSDIPNSAIDRRDPPPHWHNRARRAGYNYVGRTGGSNGPVLLKCGICQNIISVHQHTLRSVIPQCSSCVAKEIRDEAVEAGIHYIARHPDDPKLNIYRADCGHIIFRQRGQILKVGEGRNAIRCADCLEARYRRMAQSQGWKLIGKTEDNRPGYRRYRHKCGHTQNIAVANMAVQRFSCNGCSDGPMQRPSWLYVMRFTLPEQAETFVKLGISWNPQARLDYQLGLANGVAGEIVTQVAMPTGAVAMSYERRLHNRLKREFPDLVIPADDLWWICVCSEVYHAEALPWILEQVEALREKGEQHRGKLNK